MHHWPDRPAGLAELGRVAARQVVFFFDASELDVFWALRYFPEALDTPSERNAPDERYLRDHLAVREVLHVPVPKDCADGFGAAYWARPEAYLDPAVHAGMSWLAQLPADVRRRGAARLADDLESGEWHRRHGHLLELDELDAGYRIAVAAS